MPVVGLAMKNLCGVPVITTEGPTGGPGGVQLLPGAHPTKAVN